MEKAMKDRIQWSLKKYSLLEFVNEFESQLPAVVKVVAGYYGQSELETLELDEIIRVQSILRQPRVVAIDSRKNKVSLPVNCPQKFKIVRQDQNEDNEATTLSAVVEAKSFPVTVRFSGEEELKFYRGGTNKPLTFGDLTLTERFDEKFIAGNIITTGTLYPTILVVPVYVQISLVVAEGFVNESKTEWSYYLQSYAHISQLQFSEYDSRESCQEILFYDPEALRQASDNKRNENFYDYISPCDFIIQTGGKHVQNDYTETKRSIVVARTRPQVIPEEPKKLNLKNTRTDKPASTSTACQPAKKPQSAPPPPPRPPRPESFHATDINRAAEAPGGPGPPQPRPRQCPPLAPRTGTLRRTPAQVPHSPKYFQTFSDVPRDISRLSTGEITDCLHLLRMDSYAEDFQRQQVDGAMLSFMDEKCLQDEFRMSLFNARKVVMFATKGWRPNESA